MVLPNGSCITRVCNFMCVVCKVKSLRNTFISIYIQHLTHSLESVRFFFEKTLSHSVIGNTSDFDSGIQGSSPCGITRELNNA